MRNGCAGDEPTVVMLSPPRREASATQPRTGTASTSPAAAMKIRARRRSAAGTSQPTEEQSQQDRADERVGRRLGQDRGGGRRAQPHRIPPLGAMVDHPGSQPQRQRPQRDQQRIRVDGGRHERGHREQPRHRCAAELWQPAASERLAGQQPGRDRRHDEEQHAEDPDRVQPSKRGSAMIDEIRGGGDQVVERRVVGGGARPGPVAPGRGVRSMLGREIGAVIGSPPVRRGRCRPEGPPAGPDGAVGGDQVARGLRCTGGVRDREVLRQALGEAEMRELVGRLPRRDQESPAQSDAEDDDEQDGKARRRRQAPHTEPRRRRYLGRALHGSAG